MSALLQPFLSCSIQEDIEMHPAWLGRVSGLSAEKMLRKKSPFLYVLRAGENENDYYVTFVDAEGSVKHQPFVITAETFGWYYENGGPSGLLTSTIDEVIHQIMHCRKEDVRPYTQK